MGDEGSSDEYTEEEFFEEETVEETIIDDEEVVSLDDLLQEKLQRIAELEHANQLKDKQFEKLRHQMDEDTVKHREEVYFLKLELSTTVREKNASEEQMAELYNDLKHFVKEKGEREESGEAAQKYEVTMEILENQISMIKTSSREVVRIMKEEIADLMEDRCHMEVDLLNRLTSLDRAKRTQERDFDQQLELKDGIIERLRKGGEGVFSHYREIEELENEITVLIHAKKEARDQLDHEREEADEEIHRLEDANSKLEQKLKALAEDFAILRSEQNSQDLVQALDSIAKEREDIVSTLNRVADIWDRADASVLSLEDFMDRFRPTDDIQVTEDRERLLSTMETASLVHGQVKVSLLLMELKLRNQLHSLRNDNLSMAWASPGDDEVIKNMRDIEKHVLESVDHLQTTLSHQIHQIEKQSLEETKCVKETIQQRAESLETMQADYKDLEQQIDKLKPTDSDPNGQLLAPTVSFDGTKSPEKTSISNPVMDQLHDEVMKVVELMQEKNGTIKSLKYKIGEYQLREQQLKKELKRAIRRQSNEDDGKETKQVLRTAKSFRTSEESRKKQSSQSAKRLSKLEVEKQTKQLEKSKESNQRPHSPEEAYKQNSTGNISEPAVNQSPAKTSPQSIKPLKPSRRDLFRPKVSLPLFGQLPASPTSKSES